MTYLDLRLLGPPRIAASSATLDFPTRKTLALLVYLAVEGGIHSRETLAALLWPDSDGSRARANLRNTLNYLRNTLPAGELGATLHLIVERDALGFNEQAPHSLDWRILEKAAAGDDERLLQQALDCYRGDFLQGFTPGDAPQFDHWVSLHREIAHRQMNAVLDRLSRSRFEAGDWQGARQTVDRWLVHDELQEAAYQRLMRIQLAQGNRAAALKTYERCAAVLRDELNLEPAPATEALLVRAREDAVSRPATAGGEGEQETPQFADGPLVGRQEQFTTLVAAYRRAAGQELQGVIIGGEAGIGKSRLAGDFVAWAAAQGADSLAGRSFESERRLPYQPLVEALRPRLDRINAPEDLLGDVWLAALSRLLPELLDRYPDLDRHAALGRSSEPRDRIFESIARLLLGLARRLPEQAALVLWLDDLQWADAATIDALRYCCRRWQDEGARLLVLLSARSDALHPRPGTGSAALGTFVSALEREIPLTRLELDALQAADVERFLSAFHVQHPPAFSAWLQDETGGQPFYLVETLQEMAAQDALPAPGVAWQESASRAEPFADRAPRRVHHLLAGRMARLGVDAFDMLVAGAVLAQNFGFDLLCTVAGLDEDAGLHALDELLGRRLLRESGGPFTRRQAGYTFAHDKIRHVAYAEAGDARRRVFHRRALEALTRAGAPAARLAHHALASRQRAPALAHSIAAGEQALSLYAAREAIAHFEQARSLLAEGASSETVDEQQLERLHLRLGRAYELDGDYDAALATYDALQALARDGDDRSMELAALMARTTVYAAPTQHYDPQAVQLLTEQALPLAQALQDHAAEAKIRWNLMLLKLFTGELDDAVSQGEQARDIARRHHLAEIEAYAWHDLTRAYLFSGRPQEAIAAGAEAQSRWRALDNQAMLADNLITTATLDALRGRYADALSPLREAYALSKKIENKWNQSYAQHHLGLVHFELGRVQESIEAGKEAIALGSQAGFMIPVITNGCLLALLYAFLGDPTRGFPWIERAMQAAANMHERQTAGPLAAKAFLFLEQGDLNAAEEQIELALDRLQMDELSMGVFLTLPVAADVALENGQYERALAYCGDFDDYMQQRQLLPFLLDGRLREARALWALDRREEAVAILQETADRAQALQARRIHLPILLTLAQYREARSQSDLAQEARSQAAAIAQYIAGHIQDPTLRQSFQAKLKPHSLPSSKG